MKSSINVMLVFVFGIVSILLGGKGLSYAAAPTIDEGLAFYKQDRQMEARRILNVVALDTSLTTDSKRARVFAALSALKMHNYAAFTLEAQSIRQAGLAHDMAAELDWGAAIMPSYKGQWTQAKPALEQFIAEHPGTPQAARAQYDLAYLPRRQGKWKEAREALEQFAYEHTGTLEGDRARVDRAILAFDFGEETTFTQQADAFLSQRPNADADLRLEMEYRKALLPRTKGRLEEAKGKLAQFVTVHPGSAQALQAQYEIAYLPRRQGKWDEARAALEKIVADHPGTGLADQAQEDLAIMLFDFGKEDEFKQMVDTFLAQRLDAAPDLRLDLELRQGLMLRNKNKWDQAAPFFEAFAAAHPETDAGAQAQFELIKWSFNRGDYVDFQRRVELLQAQTNRGPSKMQQELKYYQALLPRMQGDFTTSRAALDKLAAESSDTQSGLEAEFRSVILAHENSDWEGFRKGAIAFMQKHPDMKADWRDQLSFGLVMIPFKQGRWEEAAQMLGDLVNRRRLGENHQAWATREYAKALLQCSAAAQSTNQPRAQALARMGKTLLGDLITSVTAALPLKQGADRQFMENVLLDAYFSKGDYTGLIQLARQFSTEHPKTTRSWAADLIWIGIAKASMTPPDLVGADAAFKEIVETPVVDNQREDHLPTKAAYWGAMTAQRRGDEAAILWYVDKILSMPEGPMKDAALAKYAPTEKK